MVARVFFQNGCRDPSIKGLFIVFGLGILGDEITHKYPLYRAFIGYVGRGTSNYPLIFGVGKTSDLLAISSACYQYKVGPYDPYK